MMRLLVSVLVDQDGRCGGAVCRGGGGGGGGVGRGCG